MQNSRSIRSALAQELAGRVYHGPNSLRSYTATRSQWSRRFQADGSVERPGRTLWNLHSRPLARNIGPFGRREPEHCTQYYKSYWNFGNGIRQYFRNSLRNPSVARFKASYPSSNTGYSTNPSPLGMVRNSERSESNTSSTYVSRSACNCSKGTSK